MSASIDAAIERIRAKAAGRTRFEGQPTPDDELLVAEIERLRKEIQLLQNKLSKAIAEQRGYGPEGQTDADLAALAENTKP